MKKIEIDIETYSSIDLSKAGVYKYAESDDFEILLFGYSVDGGVVHMVREPELQLLLEKRYLCHEKWDDIAADMGLSVQHVFRLHGEALKKVEDILKLRVNERD